jgi:hypothetical protein
VSRVIRTALTNTKFLQALIPAPPRNFRIADGAAVVQEEKSIMADLAGRYIGGPKVKVSFEHLKCSRGQVDIPVFLGFSPVFVSSEHPRFGDAQP